MVIFSVEKSNEHKTISNRSNIKYKRHANESLSNRLRIIVILMTEHKNKQPKSKL